MPIYEYECPECPGRIEVLRASSSTHDEVCSCGRLMRRLISAPRLYLDSVPTYYDHGLGTQIDSRSQRKRLMNTASLEEVGDRISHKHGAKGTVFSFPNLPSVSVPASGAYKK